MVNISKIQVTWNFLLFIITLSLSHSAHYMIKKRIKFLGLKEEEEEEEEEIISVDFTCFLSSFYLQFVSGKKKSLQKIKVKMKMKRQFLIC